MKLIKSSKIIEKKSTFYGFLYEINNEQDISLILMELKTQYKKASHFPYAYKFESKAYKTDDREPKNTAGIHFLNILERENLNNHLIVVVRIYGGIKLGASFLLRTYRKCANECIKK